MTKAILFIDVDGTLVPSTSTGAHIARELGHTDELAEAEASYARGEIPNGDVCSVDAAAWAGRRLADVADWLSDIPLVRGIEDVVRWCGKNDVLPVLSSLAWEPVTQVLAARFGTLAAGGPRLEVVDGVFTGDVDRSVEAEGKRDVAMELAHKMQIAPHACAHVGDGRSDIALFQVVGLAIAFNGSAEAESRAAVRLRGDDLSAILPALEAWSVASELLNAPGQERLGPESSAEVSTEGSRLGDALVSQHLIPLLASPAPAQYVPFLAPQLSATCAFLNLSEPVLVDGNLVIGNLAEASVVLSAHLDEASFVVTDVTGNALSLAACHRLPGGSGSAAIDLVGIRQGAPTNLGRARVEWDAAGVVTCSLLEGVRIGDRAVYALAPRLDGTFLSGKAIDDRAGAIIALDALVRIRERGISAALVLSDGEQSRPDGYFSRTFPSLLRRMHERAPIIFVDGMFSESPIENEDDDAAISAHLVPHTADGMGYLVPPLLFAQLRDEIAPAVQAAGLKAIISGRYHSRGDDWGMVTNPAESAQREACFVSFIGSGKGPERRTIDIRALRSCADMATIVAVFLASHA